MDNASPCTPGETGPPYIAVLVFAENETEIVWRKVWKQIDRGRACNAIGAAEDDVVWICACILTVGCIYRFLFDVLARSWEQGAFRFLLHTWLLWWFELSST